MKPIPHRCSAATARAIHAISTATSGHPHRVVIGTWQWPAWLEHTPINTVVSVVPQPTEPGERLGCQSDACVSTPTPG